MTQSFMAKYGWAIHCNGYHVIPVQPGTKMPGMYYPPPGMGWTGMSNWQSFCQDKATDGMIAKWATFPDAGVGIACGGVVAIDIDILDEEVAADVEEGIRLCLGDTPLKRVGKAPKRLLVYRTTEPFKKMRVGPVEALCDGQQFVACSIHPDTQQPYSWGDAGPWEVHISALPVVSAKQVAEALEHVSAWIPGELQDAARRKARESGVVAHIPASPETSLLGLTAHPDAVLSAMAAIKNPDLDWDSWNRLGMALWAASEGGAEWAYEAFHAFSLRSDKYDARETNARWTSYFRSRPHSLGAGTIFDRAREDGWEPPGGLDFHMGVMDMTGIDDAIEALTAM